MRKFASNNETALEGVSIDDREINECHSFLGLVWNSTQDNFKLNLSNVSANVKTKRHILTEIAKIYDRMGWF